jgi:two-component system, OmpR family, osmolarity sensor histidine kinase EnvZ
VRFSALTKLQLIRTGHGLSRYKQLLIKSIKFPNSTFGRIALMIAALLVINQIVSYVWVTNYIVKPQVEQTMYLIASEVKMVNQQLASAPPAELSRATAQMDSDLRNSGIRLIDTSSGEPEALTTASYYRSLTRALESNMMMPTEVRLEESDALYAWIKMPNQDRLWLRVPMARTDMDYPAPQFVFISAIMILSLVGGWWVARSISRPLKRLQFAAREIGRGDRPGDLKVVGTQELKALTRSFNQMARDVQQLEEDRTLLLAGISHDLRTPLTRIRLSTEFITEDNAELRDEIIRDTEDMDEIIDQFIAFVRDGRDEKLVLEDLNELLRAVVDPFDQPPVEIQLQFADLPDLPFKPLAMKRLLVNLIENAVRYGGNQIKVITEYDRKAIYVRVLDSGPGIKGDIAELFQPFKRGDAARGGKGTGLGLAIVRRIAGMHGGHVTLKNRADIGDGSETGLEAKLTLPLED